jgi:NMD protein affecting ribosome stability and mRNA decay
MHGRKDRLIKQKRHDSFVNLSKLPEPTVCTSCGVVYSNGRWVWKEIPVQCHKVKCPACRRIEQNYPAGTINLSGTFFEEHREEISNLIQNIETQEKNERPMERILAVESGQKTTVITTTGMHLARRIGEALSRAYNGTYAFNYLDGEDYIEVSWHR